MSAESRDASLHIVKILFVQLLFAFVFCCMYGTAPGAVDIIKVEITLPSQVLGVRTSLGNNKVQKVQSLVLIFTMSVTST